MANHPAAPLLLRQGDREKLVSLMRSTAVRVGLAVLARIVLLAAEGMTNMEIAQKVGTTPTPVIAWRARYDQAGIEGLTDADRPGRLRRIDHRAVVTATLPPPRRSWGSPIDPPGCWGPDWASIIPRWPRPGGNTG